MLEWDEGTRTVPAFFKLAARIALETKVNAIPDVVAGRVADFRPLKYNLTYSQHAERLSGVVSQLTLTKLYEHMVVMQNHSTP